MCLESFCCCWQETAPSCARYNVPPAKRVVVDGRRCICDWLQEEHQFTTNVVILLLGSKNFGQLDPAPVIHYESFGRSYHGCSTWEEDRAHLKKLLDQPRVAALIYGQTPPLLHPKLRHDHHIAFPSLIPSPSPTFAFQVQSWKPLRVGGAGAPHP